MKPLKIHRGIVAPLDRSNVDTDAIIPKQFLKLTSKKGYGKYLFYDWRFDRNNIENADFILNKPTYKDASILLARNNFGCGSSREHAPWALLDYGFKVIIATSFADIFFTNCFKNGILPIKLSEEVVQQLFDNVYHEESYQLTINLKEKILFDNNNWIIPFDISKYNQQFLLEGLDEVGLTLQQEDEIRKFEANHSIYYKL